jgi:signal transduction histidine kinase
MEKYTEIFLGAMPSDEDSGQYDPICEAIGGASRFSQAAVILRGPEGRFRLAGKAGMDGALTAALDALARRTTLDKVREIVQSKFYSQVIGHLALVDLTVLMEPGDELLQMNFREAHAVAIRGRDRELLGALLVAGLREAEAPLLTEDVLPLELLASRVGAAREQQMLLRRVFQAERLAGLGQLAGGMAHELNNPLTVVTGYAELMADNEGAVRDQAVVILNEARRMKQIIDSLVRFRKASPVNRESLSIEVVLRDIEKLLRPELERERVQCQMLIPQQLPEIRADGDQIRQVFLQVAKNAISSMDAANGDLDRRLTVEAAADSHCVQITFSDNGPGFKNPARAFDPFYTTREQGEGMGLGLSICYSIIREHGGEISAVNLLPRGAAVVIELPAAETPRQAQPFQVAKSTGESPWAPVAANGSARAI